MHLPRESNPHFHPRRNDDSVIEFPSSQLPQQRPWHPRRGTTIEPTDGAPPRTTVIEPMNGPQPKPPYEADSTSYPQQEPRPRSKPMPPMLYQAPESPPQQHGHHSPRRHDGGHRHDHLPALRGPGRRQTKPLAWLVAAFCMLFWLIVIIGGLIILIVYVVFRPRNPRFDVSTATLNAAYLDMGYLLNADATILANFTNPNTKVDIDFTYVILEMYYEKRFIATRYINPFTIKRHESRFANVHMVASHVTLSMAHSMELQRQLATGRVQLEIRGLFKSTSLLGGFRYSHWLYANCHITVTGPPTGVLIRKQCTTRR